MDNVNNEVDIIMPCYNAEKFIAEAIESIIHQTLRSFRLIVIDDASTDNTWSILKVYEKKDSRIELYRNSNNFGVAYTRNYGLRLAHGKYIAYMDADDISDPNRLRTQKEYLDANPDIGAVTCLYQRVDSHGKIVKKSKSRYYSENKLRPLLLFEDVIANAAAMFRRNIVVDNSLEYDEKDKVAEDYRFWCRFISYAPIKILNNCLYYYRINDTGLTVNFSDEIIRDLSLDEIHTYMLDLLKIELVGKDKVLFLRAVRARLEWREVVDLLLVFYRVNRQTYRRKNEGIVVFSECVKVFQEQIKYIFLKRKVFEKLYKLYRHYRYNEYI